LWKIFLDRYDNPVSKIGAVRFVKSYYAPAKTTEILALFMVYLEHFNKVDAISQLMERLQRADRSIAALFTPN
jgi:hypothetical protein